MVVNSSLGRPENMYSEMFLSLLIVFLTWNLSSAAPNYLIGAGIADMTGPAADVNMMGYANPGQVTGGIHLRMYARAFVIAEPDDSKRFVFVSIDGGMQGQGVTLEVVKQLKAKFGDRYTEKNVAISGTHSHSGPAGFLTEVLFQVTSLGFIKDTFDAFVNGIVKSIVKADEDLQPGDIYMNQGHLYNASINRSPSAYENNPAEERAMYSHNVDTNMTVLRLVSEKGEDIGMINWFAVHGTSMNNTNKLISGDNKGYASYLMEQYYNKGARPGKGRFVAAFAQSNLGDVSPNTKGAKCIDTGLPCERNSSTCNGKTENCIAFGPGRDMFESTEIIAEKQYNRAMELYKNASMKLSGHIGFVHQYVDMHNQTAHYNDSFTGKTCKSSMGFSFAAGTTDGPGAFSFTQGDTEGTIFWKIVRDAIKTPSKELIECQKPKPILLPTGEMDFPYEWQANIVDTQILRIGSFGIIVVPGEFTTMAGRRLRNTVREAMIASGAPKNTTVVIAGLSNTYADYITTYEEYQVQRYEGASTIYGPHTFRFYENQYERIAKDLVKGVVPPPGPTPPDLLPSQIALLPPVVFDRVPFRKNFGDIVTDVKSSYVKNSTALVTFRAGNPRNDLKTDKTFLSIKYQDPVTNEWNEIYNDADWCTRFYWNRTSTLFGLSEVTIHWDIPYNAASGNYQIHHYGNAKDLFRGMKSYEGISSIFKVQ
ncbi:uncharacterized protein [Amphiura filiformis]|uniref:uncharacterized protein n=1 Tax=Amphiura filiformis TaxID=82378 RepID=UPI003B20E885